MTLAWLCAVFPAHAGMSPARADLSPLRCCFPRTRGDEPTEVATAAIDT